MYRFLLSAAVSLVLSLPVQADPNPQLVRSVENGLAQYGLQADVSKFSTSTVTRLHMILSSTGDPQDTRSELKTVLRNPKYK